MTDEDLATMHRLLAEYHRNLAREAMLDVVQHYHAAQRPWNASVNLNKRKRRRCRQMARPEATPARKREKFDVAWPNQTLPG